MIKAIQTEYKGYRFRSRLEARWAVFFDSLGIKWHYEPEGYDLGDDGWYLPDFFLPDKNVWIEVKPEFNTQDRFVYLAGKIRKNCWRNEIAYMRGAEHDFENPHVWESTRSFLNRSVRITGPFFMSCDHGCSHGPATHGQGQDGCGGSYGYIADWEKYVVDQCKTAIIKSDSVFVWIDSLDCYATLIECGYAKALGKKIFCAVDSALLSCDGTRNEVEKEIWFLKTMSDDFGFFDQASDAFSHYFKEPEYLLDYRKIGRVAEENNGYGLLVGGDPMLRNAFGHKNALDVVYGGSGFESAAKKARSARFEHGEKP